LSCALLESQGDGAKKVWAHVHAAKTAARRAAKTTGAFADMEFKAESTAWLEGSDSCSFGP